MEAAVQILAASGTAAIFAAIISGLFSKRKLGADAAKVITDAAAGVVVNLNAEVVRQAALVSQAMRDMERMVEHHALEMTRMRAEAAAESVEQRRIHSEEMAKLLADHAAEMRDVKDWSRLHVAWDAIAITKLSELGVQLSDPPPPLDIG